MTPDELAAVHRACFTGMPRPWTASEFGGLLDLPEVILVQRLRGFGLGRIAGPEAELLTLAVPPDARRCGIGRVLVLEFETLAGRRGASEFFLDVAECNIAARALYSGLGYVQTAIRPGYFKRPGMRDADGLVMSKHLDGTGKTI